MSAKDQPDRVRSATGLSRKALWEELRREDLESLDKEALVRALYFAVETFHDVRNWTSKHCDDCVRNRWRADDAISRLMKMAGLGADCYTDWPLRAETMRSLRARRRTIEAEYGRKLDAIWCGRKSEAWSPLKEKLARERRDK